MHRTPEPGVGRVRTRAVVSGLTTAGLVLTGLTTGIPSASAVVPAAPAEPTGCAATPMPGHTVLTYTYPATTSTVVTIPAGVGSVTLSVCGAQGGTAAYGDGSGGKGGETTTTIDVVGPMTLNILAGEQGAARGSRTFGGGGSAHPYWSGDASGGGGSYVFAVPSGSAAAATAQEAAVAGTPLVIAGGGGGSANSFAGGAGGGLAGSGPPDNSDPTYFGGSSTTGGTQAEGGQSANPTSYTGPSADGSAYLGADADAADCAGGGGGGGYYGGGAGFCYGAAGGSGYVTNDSAYTTSDTVMFTGTHAGQGAVRISYSSTDLVTQASSATTVGAQISDSATVSTLVEGAPTPTGMVTFDLYGPQDPDCSGPQDFTSWATLDGEGSAQSEPFVPTEVGTYRWIATYGGDINHPSVIGACNDPGESTLVSKATPSLTTAPSPTVVSGDSLADTATLAGGYQPTGTIAFDLFGPSQDACADEPLSTSEAVVSGNGEYSSEPFSTTETGTYQYVARYSGDSRNDAVAGACDDPTEQVVVTAGTPSAPLDVAATHDGGVVTVTWSPPASDGGFELTSYDVTVLQGDTVVRTAGTDPFDLSAAFALEPGDYTIRVVANNERGAGPGGSTTSNVPTPPSAPLNVTAVQSGPGQITITWDPPLESGSTPVTGYSVGYSAGESGDGVVVGPDARSAVFDGLPDGAYTGSVAASSAAGTGDRATDPVTVATAPSTFVVPASPSPSSAMTPTPSASPSASSPAASAAPSCSTVATVTLDRTTIIATGSAVVTVTGPAGRTVDLLAYSQPSRVYRKVRSGTIGSNGAPLRFTVVPPSNTRLYAQVVGCSTDEAVFSRVLNVRTQLSLDVMRDDVQAYTFSGRALPARPNGLIVSLYRVTDDGRQIITAQTRANAKPGQPGYDSSRPSGAYSISRVFTGTGRFGFVVRTGQDAQNAPGSSNVRSLLVF